MPKALGLDEAGARRSFEEQRLPLVLAKTELDGLALPGLAKYPAHLVCNNFLEAATALDQQELGAFLPDYLTMANRSKSLIRVRIPKVDSLSFHFYLAWNPRLLRLNPHATRRRDLLARLLSQRLAG